MREVVVFGGNGFIGKHLVAALAASPGVSVRIASRNPGRAADPGLHVRRVRADVSDRAAVDAAVAGAEVVVDLANGGGTQWSDFERDVVNGARNVAESCLAHGVRRLIYTSSSAALYLGGRGRLTESAGTDPRPEVRSSYSRAKIEAERLLGELHREKRLPVVILRPAVVVGRGGLLSHSGVGVWASATRCVGRGNGRTPIPFVLVEDVVQALLASIEAPGIDGMTFNLAGDVRPCARDYVKRIGERTGRDFRFRPRRLATHFAIDVAKWLLKAAGGKEENPFPSWRDLASRTMSRQIDNRLAKRHLGWIPTNDVSSFLEAAIKPHARPIPPGDLRAIGS